MPELSRYQTEFLKLDGGEFTHLVKIGRSLLDIAMFDFDDSVTGDTIYRHKDFVDNLGVYQAAWEIFDPPKPYAPDQIGVVLARNSLILAVQSKRTAIHKFKSEPSITVVIGDGRAIINERDPIRPILNRRELDAESLEMFNSRLYEALDLFKINIDEIELEQAS